jgi:hypothetical protein
MQATSLIHRRSHTYTRGPCILSASPHIPCLHIQVRCMYKRPPAYTRDPADHQTLSQNTIVSFRHSRDTRGLAFDTMVESGFEIVTPERDPERTPTYGRGLQACMGAGLRLMEVRTRPHKRLRRIAICRIWFCVSTPHIRVHAGECLYTQGGVYAVGTCICTSIGGCLYMQGDACICRCCLYVRGGACVCTGCFYL